jgi:hypothetical protein
MNIGLVKNRREQRESVWPQIMPWLAIMVVWLSAAAAIVGCTVTLPPKVLNTDETMGWIALVDFGGAVGGTWFIVKAA